jgi:hypothetical protein
MVEATELARPVHRDESRLLEQIRERLGQDRNDCRPLRLLACLPIVLELLVQGMPGSHETYSGANDDAGQAGE